MAIYSFITTKGEAKRLFAIFPNKVSLDDNTSKPYFMPTDRSIKVGATEWEKVSTNRKQFKAPTTNAQTIILEWPNAKMFHDAVPEHRVLVQIFHQIGFTKFLVKSANEQAYGKTSPIRLTLKSNDDAGCVKIEWERAANFGGGKCEFTILRRDITETAWAIWRGDAVKSRATQFPDKRFDRLVTWDSDNQRNVVTNFADFIQSDESAPIDVTSFSEIVHQTEYDGSNRAERR